MNNYYNALVEVDTILDYLVEEDYKKIPQNIIDAIKENKSKDYIFNYNEELELTEQILLKETKAILYNLFRDYLATPEQREKIKKWQQEERIKKEIKKQEKFAYKELFNRQEKVNKDFENKIFQNNNQGLVEYKESLFNRIKNWVKKFFR